MPGVLLGLLVGSFPFVFGVPVRADAVSVSELEGAARSVFRTHCLQCHGYESRKAGLDLRTPGLMRQGGTAGPALVPGDSRNSLIYQHVSERSMPPAGELPLTDSQIAAIRDWIDAGASEAQPSQEYSESEARAVTAEERSFWAFRRLGRVEPPSVSLTGLVDSPVDAFVLAPLEARGLSLAQRADPAIQLRRAYFDLVGLPPTPQDVEAFLADPGEAAWDDVLDRLLASPHFGERWGRHWLDAAGYSEVRGTDYNQSLDRKADYAPGMWLYRQYVINSLNSDKPFDQFVTEQLAGDELVDWQSAEPLSSEARALLVATSFLRTAPDLTWDPPDNTVITRFGVLNQTVETVAENLLGLSLGCARCHTHKFDPIPQRDYYRMLALFTPAMDPHGWLTPHERDVKRGDEVLHALYDVGPAPPTWFLRRGEYAAPGPTVAPGFLSVLCDDDAAALRVTAKPAGSSSGRRLALARWLTEPDSRAAALVARVRVSRVWQQLFGTGLVPSSANFGVQGEPPTHPELLEWLSAEFIRGEWRLKPLLKTIMTSAVYRQSSMLSQEAGAADPLVVDPDNRLLWRMRVRRLSAEAIRDAMLAVSGALDVTPGGPPVSTDVLADGQVIVPAEDQASPTSHLRRSVYTLARRNFYPTVMTVFDQPSMVAACTQRASSTVVAQSLTLLNDEFVLQQADAFAARVLAEAASNREARIRHAWQLAVGREPTLPEVAACVRLLQLHTTRLQAVSPEANRGGEGSEPDVTLSAFAGLCQVLFNTSEFLYVE